MLKSQRASRERSKITPRFSVSSPWPSVLFHKDGCAAGVQRRGEESIQSTVPWSLLAGCLHSVGPSCSFHHKPPPRSVFLEQAMWLLRPYPLPPTDEPNLLAATVPRYIRLSHTLPKMDWNLSLLLAVWPCLSLEFQPICHPQRPSSLCTVFQLLLVLFHFRTLLPASSLAVPW